MMLRTVRSWFDSMPRLLRIALIVACASVVIANIAEFCFAISWCAEICEDKQMTLGDVLHGERAAFAILTALGVLSVLAVLLARRSVIVSAVLATIPIAVSVITLAFAVQTAIGQIPGRWPADVVWRSQLFSLWLFTAYIPYLPQGAACVMVFIFFRRSGFRSRRSTRRSTAS
jgi:hypothetical protein